MIGQQKFQGGGVSKAHFFEEKYDDTVEFLEGWGTQAKSLLWEGYGYSLEQLNGL